MQSLRRRVCASPAFVSAAVDALPFVQTRRKEADFQLPFSRQAQASLHFRREERRLHRLEKDEQGRIRETIAKRQSTRNSSARPLDLPKRIAL